MWRSVANFRRKAQEARYLLWQSFFDGTMGQHRFIDVPGKNRVDIDQ
jgi:hypothetical protein